MKFKFATLTSLSIVVLILLTSCNKSNTQLIKDSNSSIPIEKIGLNGEYDPSGLAKKVVAALKQDSLLGEKPTVYVAQKGNIIVLKGRVSDRPTLEKIVNITRNVEGVFDIDTSQVTVR
jgi:osmotically-inducible protein OsmY